MSLRPPRSTFGLVVVISLFLGGATLLLGSVVFVASHEALEKQLDHRIEAETAALLRLLEHGGTPALVRAITRDEAARRASGLAYLLVDASGRRLAGRLDASVPAPGWTELLPVKGEGGSRDVSQALTTVLPDGGRLVVAADRAPVDAIDAAILQTSAVTIIAMLLIGMAGAWTLGTIVRRRLDHINGTAQAIIDGDLARRMPRDGSSSEFDRLSETLNRMLDRNAELVETLQQVSSDIAHDLRTPLTRLHQSLEGALAEDQDAAGYRRAIEAASARSRELLDLFAALLRISEIETLKIRETFQPVDFSRVVDEVMETYRPDIEAAQHTLTVRTVPGATVTGDRRLLAQLLINLIENAVRHTPANTKIDVMLERREDRVVLRVADDGPGIPAADREAVFRRFARLERSRTTPGHGLGLNLVAAIAGAHFAKLKLSDAEPGLAVELAAAATPQPAQNR